MSGSASCTVFMPGTGGAGKCSENKQFGNCKNYSREKDRKKTQNKKEADTDKSFFEEMGVEKAVYYVAVCTENHYGEYKP